MGGIAVIYKSKYGSTKKYAGWIAERLNAELFEESEVNLKKLAEYKTIIYGGGLYASGISGISIITKNFDLIKDKNIVVFTVGLASTEDKSIFEPIITKNIPENMRSNIKFFHLRGGMDYSKLNFKHKAMMSMLKKIVQKKEEKSEEDIQMLETYGETVDFTEEKTIEPLIMYVNSL